MKITFSIKITAIIIYALLLPALANAQSDQTAADAPPIEQPIVREGDLAIKIVDTFAIGVALDEIEAENKLAEIGITPRNGWIADYPVTPDIIDEVQSAVINAANSGRLHMKKDEALQKFRNALDELGLPVSPYTGTDKIEPSGYDSYPAPSIINNYYYSQAPPVVTYYTPPPGYYHMYAWVPYPFWWLSFRFPGFFVLHDFHRVVVVKKKVVVVTNHFNDLREHRVFRIDPVKRFKGTTFSGIGAPRKKVFISPGVRRGEVRIFNRRHDLPEADRTVVRPSDRGKRDGRQMGVSPKGPSGKGRSGRGRR